MNNEQGREIRGSRIVVEWTRSSGEGREGGGRGRGRVCLNVIINVHV